MGLSPPPYMVGPVIMECLLLLFVSKVSRRLRFLFHRAKTLQVVKYACAHVACCGSSSQQVESRAPPTVWRRRQWDRSLAVIKWALCSSRTTKSLGNCRDAACRKTLDPMSGRAHRNKARRDKYTSEWVSPVVFLASTGLRGLASFFGLWRSVRASNKVVLICKAAEMMELLKLFLSACA